MRRAVRQILTLGLLLASTHLLAQTSAIPAAPAQRNLSEFEGLYEYRDGGTLTAVADGARLVAIIGEAVPASRSRDGPVHESERRPIPFLRGAGGRVVAFKEGNETFPRRSTSVAPAMRWLLEPRPKGPDGRPAVYRYTLRSSWGMAFPWARRDRDRCRPMRPPDSSTALSTAPIRVRSILIYHKGALRLEVLLRLRP